MDSRSLVTAVESITSPSSASNRETESQDEISWFRSLINSVSSAAEFTQHRMMMMIMTTTTVIDELRKSVKNRSWLLLPSNFTKAILGNQRIFRTRSRSSKQSIATIRKTIKCWKDRNFTVLPTT